ncbi:MAG: hypothetical protein HXY29_01895 [Rhodocyclaceae bacterium]|nr:hypothetical protein [Rhodocyclaceae bacterium]
MKPAYPKILPWLAHKAGISQRRAEILWHAACRHAAHATNETDTPAYWAAAMDRLLELVVAERLREDAASFGFRRWARLNARLWQAPLAVLDALMIGSQRGWRRFKSLSFS